MMEDYKGTFENLGLSLEQEIEKEDTLSMHFLFAETTQEAEEIMTEYAELAKSSNNGRTLPKIQKCVNSLKFKCSGSDICNVIIDGITEDLFPILYTNIVAGEEGVTMKQFKDMTQSLNLIMEDSSLNDITKFQIAKALFKLFVLMNGNTNREAL